MSVGSRHLAAFLALALAGALATGCGKGEKKAPGGGSSRGAPAAGSEQGPTPPPGATLAIAGQMFDGSDPAAIRAYLKSVTEVKPKRFDVKWNPATVAVDREAAMRSLQAISQDGSEYTFTASEPAIAALKPGSILWIWDIAIRRVDSLATADGTTLVRTSPVPLSEALTEAHIEFEAPIDLRNSFMAYRPHLLPEPASHVSRASSPPGPVMFAMARGPAGAGSAVDGYGYRARVDSPAPDENPPHEGSPPGAEKTGEDDWGQGVAMSNLFAGKVKGYEYALLYASRNTGATLTLEAKKEDEGADLGQVRETNEQVREKFQEAMQETAELDAKVHEADDELFEAKSESFKEQTELQSLTQEYQEEMKKLKAENLPKDPNQLMSTEEAKATAKFTKEQAELEEKIQEAAKKTSAAQQAKDEALAARKKISFDLLKNVKWMSLAEFATSNLDVRFRSSVDLDDFVLDDMMDMSNGKLDQYQGLFKDLKGDVKASIVARWGQKGNGTTKVPVMHLPIAFYIPIPVGGIPFMVQLAADFNVNVFLTGAKAALKLDGKLAFSGSAGLSATGSASTSIGNGSAGKPEVTSYEGNSLGVSGVVWGLQLPRLGVGLGMVGFYSVAYVDQVTVFTMTNGAAVASPLGLPPCKRVTLDSYGHVGIETQVPQIPFVPFLSTVASAKLSPSKQIWHTDFLKTDPPIKACEI